MKSILWGDCAGVLSLAFFFIWFTDLAHGRLFYGDAFNLFLITFWICFWSHPKWICLRDWAQKVRPALLHWKSFFALYFFWSAVWAGIALVKHYAFSTDEFDVGIFGQVLYHLGRGKGYLNHVDIPHSYFSVHQNLTLPLLAPLYWTPWGTPLLLVLQSFLIFLPGLLVSVALLKNKSRLRFEKNADLWAFGFLLLWIYSAPLIRNTFWEFHETCMSVGFLTLWAWGWVQRKPRMILVGGVLAGLTKENLWIAIIPATLLYPWIGLGIGLGIGKGSPRVDLWRQRLKWAGVSFLFFSAFYLGHHFFSEMNYSLRRYSGLGTSSGAVLTSVLTRPELWVEWLSQPEKRNFVRELLDYVGLLPPVLSGFAILTWLPHLGMHLLSSHPPQYSTYFHYVLEIWPGLFISALIFWHQLVLRFPKHQGLILTVFFTLTLLPLSESPRFRFQEHQRYLVINAPIAMDIRNQVKALRSHCNQLNGIAERPTFTHVFDLGNVYPELPLAELKTKRDFQAAFFSDREGSGLCNFILASAPQAQRLRSELPGGYLLKGQWDLFGRDRFELWVSEGHRNSAPLQKD